MAGMTEQEYRDMVESSDIDTRLAEIRDPAGQLLAVCLLDWLADGPSAVYSFFQPLEFRRSLGTYVVLSLIDAARQAGSAPVYPVSRLEPPHTMPATTPSRRAR